MPAPGQPTLYKPEYIELAHNYCLLGATNEVLGNFFGVTRRTIQNWIAAHPDFADAVHRGRRVADGVIVRALFERAKGFSGKVTRTTVHKGEKAHHHQHSVLPARHPGLHVLAAQPPAPILTGRSGDAAGTGGRRRRSGGARCRHREQAPCRRVSGIKRWAERAETPATHPARRIRQ